MQHSKNDGNRIPFAETGRLSRFWHGYFAAATVSLCFLLSSGTAHAQAGCVTAPLTGSYSVPPCSLPQPPAPPGLAFRQYLDTWYTTEFQPRLMDMTKQLYSYRVWETFDLGRLMDTQDLNRAARIEQEQRVTAQQGAQPDDQVCLAGFTPLAQTRTALNAAALTQGFKQDLLRRAHNASKEPVNGSYTPPDITPRTDVKMRWEEFCKEFNDTHSNNEQNVCGDGAAEGTVKNQDISVESFLFRDTIDLNNPDEYKAAKAILINIVNPVVHEILPVTVTPTTSGQEHILRQQHIEAIRNIAADVVSSIISRRAPLAQTDKDMAKHVLEIRKLAGVTECPQSPKPANGSCYSTTPSYNEIMLAMTKERFFNPGYFNSVESNPGSVQQEQAAIEGYTTVQLQDIYKMQEQINALLAARASLKLSTDQASGATAAAPNASP